MTMFAAAGDMYYNMYVLAFLIAFVTGLWQRASEWCR
jgi:hypothetical protein